jgi:hypothetical protein
MPEQVHPNRYTSYPFIRKIKESKRRGVVNLLLSSLCPSFLLSLCTADTIQENLTHHDSIQKSTCIKEEQKDD